MTTDYTGPIRNTKEEWETFYHRVKDVCAMARYQGEGLACNSADKAMLIDMMERVIEDDTYPHDELPPLVVRRDVKAGTVMGISMETAKILTFAQMNKARSGFGRFKGLVLPSGIDGLNNPWRLEGNKNIRVLEAD